MGDCRRTSPPPSSPKIKASFAALEFAGSLPLAEDPGGGGRLRGVPFGQTPHFPSRPYKWFCSEGCRHWGR